MSTLSRVPRTGRSAGTAKQVVPNDWPSARSSRRMTGSHGGSARSGMPPSSPPHEARTVANTIEGAISLIGPGVWHRIVSLEPPPGIWPAWIATRSVIDKRDREGLTDDEATELGRLMAERRGDSYRGDSYQGDADDPPPDVELRRRSV